MVLLLQVEGVGSSSIAQSLASESHQSPELVTLLKRLL